MNTEKNTQSQPEQLSLNDDRRVKVLSPTALVLKRFLRNQMAVVGLAVLAFMFVFSFLGGLLSPYGEDQLFYTEKNQEKQFAGVVENDELRYAVADGQQFGSALQAQVVLTTLTGKNSFTYKNTNYNIITEGKDFYSIALEDGTLIGIAYKDIVNPAQEKKALTFDFIYAALKAYTNSEKSFACDGSTFEMDEYGTITKSGEEIAYVSRYVVQAVMPDIFLSRAFKEELTEAILNGETTYSFVEADGSVSEYHLTYDAASKNWSVLQERATRVFDTYSAPSKAHPLGTDRNGMDMLTRLMYGGRVSLIIGFIVVIIETLLGIVMGGISGYFGGWIDNLIMRIVDIFYCIPSMPIIIILGAAMDSTGVDPQIRMLYLMLILGFLGWPSVARMVRGQILSLREQEFMTATEACGIRVSRRIFRHLIPNVIPQLIVICTMGLGSVILTEATLSFLGLGVKFPFASWGNIINDVNDTYVLTHYWFIWIPAGVCLLLTVLAFNLVGDGLRDAFDPKMKR